jgi:hypothetical protein
MSKKKTIGPKKRPMVKGVGKTAYLFNTQELLQHGGDQTVCIGNKVISSLLRDLFSPLGINLVLLKIFIYGRKAFSLKLVFKVPIFLSS